MDLILDPPTSPQITLAIFSSRWRDKAPSFTWAWMRGDLDLYIAWAFLTKSHDISKTKSRDKHFRGSSAINVNIWWRTKVRSTMYVARYIAVDSLQKKEKVITNICVKYCSHPFWYLLLRNWNCSISIIVPRAGKTRHLSSIEITFAVVPSALPRNPLSYAYSLLQRYPPLVPNNLIRQRFYQFHHPFKKFLSGKYLENECRCSFPRTSIIYTDLEWIVKIPDLENVIMDACNAIDQSIPLKENTIT